MNTKIKNIIFDFGGVLLNLDPSLTVEALYPFYKKEDQKELWKILIEYELGHLNTETFIWKLQKLAIDTPHGKEIIDAWNAMLLNLPIKNIELLSRLKEQGYKIFLLSNTNALHIEHVLQRIAKDHQVHDFEAIFDGVIYSHKVHMRKPNLDIYEHTLTDFGLQADESLFIDDREENIDGALKASMNAQLHQKNYPISEYIDRYLQKHPVEAV